MLGQLGEALEKLVAIEMTRYPPFYSEDEKREMAMRSLGMMEPVDRDMELAKQLVDEWSDSTRPSLTLTAIAKGRALERGEG